MAKSKGKRKLSKLKKKHKPLKLELVSDPSFYEMMYDSMASEAWTLDHRRKPSEYIR
jgi:hypothetical protein